jgi:hypothetical protein
MPRALALHLLPLDQSEPRILMVSHFLHFRNWLGEWFYWKSLLECDKCETHEGNTMRKIMGNKPQVSSAIIIQSSANILEWPSALGSDCWCFYN